MTAIFGAWMAEFILEASGSIFNFKRSKLLSFTLAVVALMDAVTFVIFRYWPESYPAATWIRHAIRNLMLMVLGCSVCGMFAEEKNRVQAGVIAGFLSLGMAAFCCSIGLAGNSLKDRLLTGEIVACSLLLSYIFLAWVGKSLKDDNGWTACGFMVMVGSDLIFTAMWTFWDGARHWYPLGAIAAYLIWVAGPMRRVKLPEFRQSLQHKFGEIENVRHENVLLREIAAQLAELNYNFSPAGKADGEKLTAQIKGHF